MTSRGSKRAEAARRRLQQQQAAARRRRTIFVSATVAALLVIAGLIGWGVYSAQQPATVQKPPSAVENGTGLKVGDGPVTVDLYVDFLCPVCKQYEQQAGPLLDRYVADGRITLVYHPVNFLDPLTSTDYSTRSAAAAAAAADEGKFPEYAKALFADQPPEGGAGLSDSQLVAIGRSVGLTSDSFAKAVTSDKYHDWVSYVARKADERGVRGTPTVFVNGKQIDNTPEALRTAVDNA